MLTLDNHSQMRFELELGKERINGKLIHANFEKSDSTPNLSLVNAILMYPHHFCPSVP